MAPRTNGASSAADVFMDSGYGRGTDDVVDGVPNAPDPPQSHAGSDVSRSRSALPYDGGFVETEEVGESGSATNEFFRGDRRELRYYEKEEGEMDVEIGSSIGDMEREYIWWFWFLTGFLIASALAVLACAPVVKWKRGKKWREKRFWYAIGAAAGLCGFLTWIGIVAYYVKSAEEQ